jgi:hypothetical protein
MKWVKTIFSRKIRLRGWPVVEGYFYEVLWLSVFVTMVAHLLTGGSGRAELYFKIMDLTVVPIYAIRTYIELHGRNVLPQRALHEKFIATIFILSVGLFLISLPWFILMSAHDNIGRSHLVYVALRESVFGLALVGAGFVYVAVLVLYGIFGALPLMWKSTNRR